MENEANHFDVDQHQEFPAFRQSLQTPLVTRECFLLPAKGRDLWENPAMAPGTWHAWKYIWREGRISIWKKELTWEEIGDCSMTLTWKAHSWICLGRRAQKHSFPHLQMQIYFACRTNVKGAPGPSSRNLQQIAWDGPVLLHQAQTLWMGTHLQVHPKKHCLSQITLLEKEWGIFNTLLSTPPIPPLSLYKNSAVLLTVTWPPAQQILGYIVH